MSEWQPIETAPRDGTHILAILPDSDTCYVICWADMERDIRGNLGSPNVGWHIAYDGYFLQPNNAPTYWMPLPPPPTETPNYVMPQFKDVQDMVNALSIRSKE